MTIEVRAPSDRVSRRRSWRDSLAGVPRQAFVPEAVRRPTSQGFVILRRGDDVGTWLDLAHAEEEPLVVAIDYGSLRATATMSCLSDVATVLGTLDAGEGERICHIGTCTGYLAAVLARRIGPGSVTTIEVDERLAAAARENLATVGLGAVTVITGDGRLGHLPGAPYDALVSTATVREVPYAWVEQVRPGGRIVTGWGTPFAPDWLLRLTVGEDGTATGGIAGSIHTEWLHGQRPADTTPLPTEKLAGEPSRSSDFDLEDVLAGRDARLAVGLRMVDVCSVAISERAHWLADPHTNSWAHALRRWNDDRYTVHQFGIRQLWYELENAYDDWKSDGEPTVEDWRFTVTSDGTRVALRDT